MILTIIVFLIILGLLIFVHEFGHFISAKKAGIKVEEFGFGFPPRLFGIKRGETIYSINWIPLGGFVKIYGEDGKGKEDKKSFASRHIWQRAIILTAGVAMNFVLAALLLSIGFKLGLPQVLEGDEKNIKEVKIQLTQIVKNSPADRAGLKVGDEIIALNGKQIENIEEFQKLTKKKAGKEIILQIKRLDERNEIKITPRRHPPENEGALGVALAKTAIISYPWYEALWRGITMTFSITILIIVTFYEIIKNLILGQPLAAELAGPVGIAVLTHQATKMGFVYVLQFTALLSINLAIINILPFPALDGGRLLFLAIEKIRKKPVDQKIENLIHTIGFALLILLMVFVTFRDVTKFKDLFINLWNKIAG
ncbi:MAG: RIP metalloprotease RseP [Patescibacteria group bacterium]